MHTPQAWIGVVSQAHVMRGVEGGFAQLCHGKRGPLARMRRGDWLAYYSPTTQLGAGTPLKAFTALGQLLDDDPFEFDMGGGFVPWRRRVSFVPATRVAPLELLRPVLSFTRGGASWGLLARRGHFEATLDDVRAIASGLGVSPFPLVAQVLGQRHAPAPDDAAAGRDARDAPAVSSLRALHAAERADGHSS
jgi:hypothetical protein